MALPSLDSTRELALWTAACGPAVVVCYRGGRTTAAARDELVDQPTWVATRAITIAPLPTDVWPWIDHGRRLQSGN